MGYGEIYKSTWWGLPVQFGWGGIYYDLAFPSAADGLLAILEARATNYENAAGTTIILTALENCEL